MIEVVLLLIILWWAAALGFMLLPLFTAIALAIAYPIQAFILVGAGLYMLVKRSQVLT